LADLPWQAQESGLALSLRLTPKAGRDQIDGIGEDPSGKPVLLVRVAAQPLDGAANKALLKFLGKVCGVAKSRLQITSGETSRFKRLMINGDPSALAKTLSEAAK